MQSAPFAAPTQTNVATRPQGMIVVLEDDEPTCELYQFLLEEQGYRLGLFKDHDRCCAFIRQTHPDLLIFDVIGSTPNGLSVLESLHDEMGARLPPVIIATALQNYQIAHHPALHHIPQVRTLFKPFNINEMVAIVKEFC
jgi:DNA-binding response OmpR family regulator